jgi:hypothetical protein
MNNKNLRERKINLAGKIMKKNPAPSAGISLCYFIFLLLEESVSASGEGSNPSSLLEVNNFVLPAAVTR